MELCIDRLTKQYGKKIAVDRVSLNMTNGVYGLLGPNGSGKTTLMRMLADVLRPTSGEIAWNGTDILKLNEDYRDIIGYLPQDFGYYRDFTAIDFLLYLASIKGINKTDAKQKAAELLKTVGLENESRNKIKKFSGGMRQRLGIAQALLNDPSFLILDEPTAGLDPKERIRFRNLISDISGKRIVLLSTHIVSDIEYIANHVVMMKKGQFINQGSCFEIAQTATGKVWTIILNLKEAEIAKEKHNIASLRHIDGSVELRIISENCPHEKAVPTEPNIEDAYLYYFGEVNEA